MEEIRNLLKSFGNLNLSIKEYRDDEKIPMMFRNHMVFYDAEIFKSKCLVAFDKENKMSLKSLQNLQNISKSLGFLDLLYIQLNLTKMQRKKLRENYISYLDQNDNFFLKSVSLSENGLDPIQHIKKEKLSVLAQQVYLYFLYQIKEGVVLKDVSDFFVFSEMHASRALSELMYFGLIEFSYGGKTGRSKVYRVKTGINFFRKGFELAQSPIKAILRVNTRPDGSLLSSESALSYLSLLSEPEDIQIALYRKEQIQEDLEGVYQCELWKYDPNIFGIRPCIDVFSLACALKHIEDPRVQAEMESVLKKQRWYKE